MTHTELRQKFIEFFIDKGHIEIPSASLIPINDPTVLFTTAGMHPLVPFLLGQKHPAGQRLVNIQKCVRTGDIDEVGDDTHLTFFEMLGNWSLGDYFKKDAIAWSFEFLTDVKWLGISPRLLAFTCFAGDNDASRDDESAKLWLSYGVKPERIAFLPKEDNWWGPAGQTGPCGPDTEMFYWVGSEPAPEKFDPKNKQWVEIWNDVFMQYNKTADGKYEPLAQKNVDTGMGLERTLAVLNSKKSVYETELLAPILNEVRKGIRKESQDGERMVRIIADHMRTALFLIADGVEPSNKDRGYVLRRLLRRASVFARQLGLETGEWEVRIFNAARSVLADVYPEFKDPKHIERTNSVAKDEVDKFKKTLDRGLNEFMRLTDIDGKKAFDLYQTFGFPWELTYELARQRGLYPDKDEFEVAFKKHKDLSRTASAGQFEGGLADHSEIIVRYHTVTHLMNAALRKVLGKHVMQKGSNITAERTRFDFTHPQKLTDAEKAQVESLVNDWIARNLTVEREMMPLKKARELGAIGAFGEKYGETVSVYSVFDEKTNETISREFCGGPHVVHIGEIGKFRIIKEEAISAGVRRIRAVVE